MSSNPDKTNPPARSDPTKDDHPPSSSETTTKNPSEPSILNRVKNSATSLIQDALTKPSAGTLPSDLAHALNSGNNNKGYASASASASSSTYLENARRRDGASSSPSDGIYDHDAEAFRSGSTHPSTSSGVVLDPLEINSFQNTGRFHSLPDEFSETKGKGKAKQTFENHDYADINEFEYDSTHFNEYEIAWINASRQGSYHSSSTTTNSTPTKRLSSSGSTSSVHNSSVINGVERNEKDGAEVVSLLSDPSFQPGLSTWDDQDSQNMDGYDFTFGADDPLDMDGFPIDPGLSPAELKILESFRLQHQTQNQEENKTKRITPYSLIPDIDSFLSQHMDTNHGISSDENLRDEVLTNLVGAEEWVHVDEQYSDDVWGYLRPALEAAAAEIKEKEAAGKEDEDGPAVKRLKMILRHMARIMILKQETEMIHS
ncbi:conserved hypothetical protein [Talaromyces stipitatus ATCC 10500]|uniref:Uncharacterized protein n=1 Tax=Talaromyces stipitatus (strain ATCC 10500 / CBS 375.48 / QM 6759 / NRRL 1006) TaxID=441959 RepID=B8MQI4_TALSN|nr:uncharacterized protein TSTA_058740 [Talaromyces stipitatus ATCC 10500]EED13386.1 conserved hypothetical protein [Talaromyces stipitatus ATCC 10500]